MTVFAECNNIFSFFSAKNGGRFLWFSIAFHRAAMPGPGRGGTDHALCAGLPQDFCALGQGGAGGDDVVDQQHPPAPDSGAVRPVDAVDIAPAGVRVLQAGLRPIVDRLPQ